MISHLNFVPAGAGARSDVARVVDGVRGAVMHVGRARVVQDEDAEAHAAVLLLHHLRHPKRHAEVLQRLDARGPAQRGLPDRNDFSLSTSRERPRECGAVVLWDTTSCRATAPLTHFGVTANDESTVVGSFGGRASPVGEMSASTRAVRSRGAPGITGDGHALGGGRGARIQRLSRRLQCTAGRRDSQRKAPLAGDGVRRLTHELQQTEKQRSAAS